VFAFVFAEGLDHLSEFRIGPALTELFQLFGIVLVDLGLDRRGARHRRFWPEERRASAQHIARRRPERMQRCGAHPALHQQRIELGAVLALLLGHVADFG
jgi:hypothetical protein